METTTKSAAEQFAWDYLLIVGNDQSTWNYIQEAKEEVGSAYALACFLQEEFEEGAAELIDGAQLAEVSQMLFRQLLLSWGIEPWLIIARDIWDRN